MSYFEKITPGQSSSLTYLSNLTYCKILVDPGVEDTSHVLDLFKLLITELFPTLGYPISPTVTALLFPYTLDNCLINCNRWSGPIALDELTTFYAI